MSAFEVGNTALMPFETDPDVLASRSSSKNNVDHCFLETASCRSCSEYATQLPSKMSYKRHCSIHSPKLRQTLASVFAGNLWALSYRRVGGDTATSVLATKQCRICAEVVELIHAGSLIVDDIEDHSPMRRRRTALHVRYGMPIALNAGN